MRENGKKEHYDISNPMLLSFKNEPDEQIMLKNASEMSTRFSRSASLFLDEEFLGIQFDFSKRQCVVFSSPNAPINVEDYEWIFNHGATVSNCSSEYITDLYEDNRRVYVLSFPKSNDSITGEALENNLSKELLFDTLLLLAKDDAIIRVIVGNNQSQYARLFISIKDEMTLRLRSALSLLFSHVTVTEVYKSSDFLNEESSCELVTDSIRKIVYLFMCQSTLDCNNKKGNINNNLYVDIVFLIDKSSRRILSVAPDFIYLILMKLMETAETVDKSVSIRVKAVGFGDLSSAPLFETGFYSCKGYGAFLERLTCIEPEANCINHKVDTFEAICTALKSKWTTERRSRHCIIVLSNSITNELGTNRNSKYYPQGIPDSFSGMADLWHGMKPFSDSFSAKSARLITITTKHLPLENLQYWDRYWPIYISKTSNSATDIKCLFDLILEQI